MEREQIREERRDPHGETSERTDPPNVQPSQNTAPVWLVVVVVVLAAVSGFVLYITNSRITDLEIRLAALSNSTDSKPKPASARVGGPDPEKIYVVKIDDAPIKGSTSAPVTIVEASDFQCPYCSQVRPTLDKVLQVYGDKVHIVWKHLPLPSLHPNAIPAAVAAEAAKKQGKFWEYHDKLFANQNQLSAQDLRRYAAEVQLDLSKFDADIADAATKKRVTDDAAEIGALGVTGTPAFFINGRFINGAQPFETFAGVINAELKRLNIDAPAQ
jgi:protein-disulfide isomerase